jgi:probable HAF family extracellular repeat protein
MTTFRRALVPALAAALAAPAFGADVLYEAVDLGSLGDGSTTASAVNASGHVVGNSRDATGTPAHWPHAFLYSDGTMQDLGTLPGCVNSFATGINASDQVVGWAQDSSGGYHGWIWQNGTMSELPFPQASGINDAGRVVGSEPVAPGSSHVMTWLNGTVNDLGDVGGDQLSVHGINNVGSVTGIRSLSRLASFMCYSDGTVVDIGNTHHGEIAFAYGLNDDDWVVGQNTALVGPGSWTWQAFMWNDGQFYELGALLPGAMSSAYGINKSRQVVGFGNVASGLHAILWDHGALFDLNDRLVAGSSAAGDLMTATAINDNAQIVVNGVQTWNVVNGGVTITQHAYLLTPVTSPSADANGGTGGGSVSAADSSGSSSATSAAASPGGSRCGAGSGVAATLIGLAMALGGIGRRRR